jgi:hypothetical protein
LKILPHGVWTRRKTKERERYESSQGVLKPRVKEKGMREREGKVIKG